MNIQKYNKKLKSLLKSSRYRFSNKSIYNILKKEGGIYRITSNNNKNKTLYIGKAKDIKQRLYNNLLMGQIRSHTLKRKFIRAGNCKSNNSKRIFKK